MHMYPPDTSSYATHFCPTSYSQSLPGRRWRFNITSDATLDVIAPAIGASPSQHNHQDDHVPTLTPPQPSPRRVRRKVKFAFVELSPWAFRCTWLGILALHGLCLSYFAVFARLYWHLPKSYLDVCLNFDAIGMKNTHYHLPSVVHWVFVSAHGLLASFMVLGSLFQRRLVFYPLQDINSTRKLHQTRSKQLQQTGSSALSTRQQLQARVMKIYDAIYGRFGLFGVESRYFEEIILFRESTETILQSYQAYRMSLYVPRIWLNRVFVALLVLYCWLTPLILVVFKSRPMPRRVLCLLCDAILDLSSSIGIPLILLLSYAGDYSSNLRGFSTYYWYDDVWFVNVLNEFQLILVVNWMDLFSRVVFYLGFLGCLESMKDLLRPRASGATKRVGPSPGSSFVGPTIDEVLPSVSPSGKSSTVPVPPPQATDSMIIRTITSIRTRYAPWTQRLKGLIHIGFVVWGFAVMILHLRAERHENLTQCLMQVRPWTANKPACALLIMDCHIDDVSGRVEDIMPQWDLADEATVTRILIRHCPQLHVPSKITAFRRLYAIKIYNSTIMQWNEDAALTNRYHSAFSSLLMIRTNFSDGQLPQGLLSNNIPQLLYDIEFQITNLRILPDDLDTKWLAGSYLYFENCQFDQFPSALHNMAPSQLSFAFNRFTTFPFQAFQIKGLKYFSVAGNPISTLSKSPYESVVDVGSIGYLYLLQTNISYLPQWIDPLIKRVTNHRPLYMRDMPFYKTRYEVTNRTRARFPELETVPLDELSFVMSLTADDLVTLDKKISCTFSDLFFYPYSHVDERYGLTEDS